MNIQTLAPQTKSVLDTIKTLDIIKNFYLSGGTALALYLGHRESEDLDFFSQSDFDPFILQETLAKIGKIDNITIDKGTLNVYFQNVKLQFLYYPYDLLEPFREWNDIYLSSLSDIACTKLITISMRGSKKDFIDLYVVLQNTTINDLLIKLQSKYKNVDLNVPSIIKSLTYFEDAEQQPMPKMHIPLDWKQVKDFFQHQIKQVTF